MSANQNQNDNQNNNQEQAQKTNNQPDLRPYNRDLDNIECPQGKYTVFHFVSFYSNKLTKEQTAKFIEHLRNCIECQNFAQEVRLALSGLLVLDRKEQIAFLCFLVSPFWQELERQYLIDKIKEEINDDLGAISFMLKKIERDTAAI